MEMDEKRNASAAAGGNYRGLNPEGQRLALAVLVWALDLGFKHLSLGGVWWRRIPNQPGTQAKSPGWTDLSLDSDVRPSSVPSMFPQSII
jgi:hypothetical protein